MDPGFFMAPHARLLYRAYDVLPLLDCSGSSSGTSSSSSNSRLRTMADTQTIGCSATNPDSPYTCCDPHSNVTNDWGCSGENLHGDLHGSLPAVVPENRLGTAFNPQNRRPGLETRSERPQWILCCIYCKRLFGSRAVRILQNAAELQAGHGRTLGKGGGENISVRLRPQRRGAGGSDDPS
jgi:hypothetical protein